METRKRIRGGKYELCRICVPPTVAEYIRSKREMLRDGEARQLYEQLKEEYRLSPNYSESRRLQYLYELMWVIDSHRVDVRTLCKDECVPTNYLEREDSSWGFDKVQPCEVLSLQVYLSAAQREVYPQLEAIVEGKMRSFKTDFYFHDMMTFSRDLGRKPILWNVAGTHTWSEVHDAEDEAERWVNYGDEQRLRHFVYGGEDDTWMGSVLRVMASDCDLYYYHDGAQLHKVSREKFKAIHDRHVERVHQIIREKIEERKAT